ncbi:hypothetical protein AGLY_007414 [Aphis glycines]|uniref:Uncharacterized protein n=1 Tax=Aphis glycines TaxID=307491 RepID=A0A6G0TNL8_APHGL|nr:hypothetical protein AGLY_007414 [Aphis glycines]
MYYAKSDDEHNTLFERLKSEAPTSVFDYFVKNWHNIKNEWVTGLTYHSGNFLNDTNNRLESFNGKLKSVVPTFFNLDRNIIHFIKMCKIRTRHESKTDLIQYFSLLTPYAFDYVKKQFEIKTKVLSATTVNNCAPIGISTIGSKIADLLSTLPSPYYENKIEQLHYIYNSLKEGKELFIQDNDDLKTLPSPNHDSPPLNDISPASPNHLNNGASISNQPNTLQPQSPNHDSAT